MRNHIRTGWLTLSLLSLLFVGCRKFEHHEGVLQMLEKTPITVRQNQELTPPPAISLVQVVEPYQGGVFFTETRQNKIGRFPCSNCHNGEAAIINDAREMAHGEIVLNHGAVTRPDACDTCHDLDKRDFLKGANNQQIAFDHSYQKCAQCHFRQEKDWIGGAHGKRLLGWDGTRVVANCTTCHNPHAPRFKKRWPATYAPSDNVWEDDQL